MSDDAPSPLRDFAKELYSSDGWKYRRALLFSVVLFFSSLTALTVFRNGDAVVLQQTLVAAIVSLTGAYVFGAVWDDSNKRKFLPPHADLDHDPDPQK